MADNFQFNVQTAWESLRGISVVRAVNYLTYIFDCPLDEVKMEDELTTPQQIAYGSHPSMRARCIPIYFWGGPPGDEEWFKGNLVAMLIDRLFFNIAIGNSEVVGRFQESFKQTNA